MPKAVKAWALVQGGPAGLCCWALPSESDVREHCKRMWPNFPLAEGDRIIQVEIRPLRPARKKARRKK